MDKMSVQLIQFDDLIRCFTVLLDTTCEKEFLRYVKKQEEKYMKNLNFISECKCLKSALDAATKNVTLLDRKLSVVRKLMDEQKQGRKLAETERDALFDQLQEVRNLLQSDPCYNKLPDEARGCLSFLNQTISMSTRSSQKNLDSLMNLADESDFTTSLLSESSFSHSEDNLDDSTSFFSRSQRIRRSSIVFADENTGTVKRKKSAEMIASFTPTAPRAESLQSSNSDESDLVVKKNLKETETNLLTPTIQRINANCHKFVAHNTILKQTCMYCDKKSGFNRNMWKCKNCNAVSHAECVDKVPLPCIAMETPKKGIVNTISTYAPNVPPMIPAMIVHCVNEIENRGLKEVGLYKISGSEAGVQNLREKFLKGRGAPNLSEESIHDICSYLKNFLHTLYEPVIPRREWNTFARAVVDCEKKNRLYYAVSLLPQPNRDTLAYLVLHLQRVLETRECKVSRASLIATFAPAIVGYSENEQASGLQEAQTARIIMEELLSLPPNYWCSLISFNSISAQTYCAIRSTPSAENFLKKSHNLFTSGGRKRYFNTPPHK